MSVRTTKVRIEAEDAASAVFETVGKTALKRLKDVGEAGRFADQLGRRLDDMVKHLWGGRAAFDGFAKSGDGAGTALQAISQGALEASENVTWLVRNWESLQKTLPKGGGGIGGGVMKTAGKVAPYAIAAELAYEVGSAVTEMYRERAEGQIREGTKAATSHGRVLQDDLRAWAKERFGAEAEGLGTGPLSHQRIEEFARELQAARRAVVQDLIRDSAARNSPRFLGLTGVDLAIESERARLEGKGLSGAEMQAALDLAAHKAQREQEIAESIEQQAAERRKQVELEMRQNLILREREQYVRRLREDLATPAERKAQELGRLESLVKAGMIDRELETRARAAIDNRFGITLPSETNGVQREIMERVRRGRKLWDPLDARMSDEERMYRFDLRERNRADLERRMGEGANRSKILSEHFAGERFAAAERSHQLQATLQARRLSTQQLEDTRTRNRERYEQRQLEAVKTAERQQENMLRELREIARKLNLNQAKIP